MSLEVLLIPLGIAAIAAIKEARSTDLCEKCKTTRIKDQGLLLEALATMGASHLSHADGRVTGESSYGRITFQRIGEVFLGRVDGSETLTAAMLSELDMTAGRIVQNRTVDSLRARAAEMGLTLIMQTADDGNVQLVFEQVQS